MNIIDKRQIIVKDEYDVIVVGGGIAGVCAAVSSARKGSKTSLIEKQVNLGGLQRLDLYHGMSHFVMVEASKWYLDWQRN